MSLAPFLSCDHFCPVTISFNELYSFACTKSLFTVLNMAHTFEGVSDLVKCGILPTLVLGTKREHWEKFDMDQIELH